MEVIKPDESESVKGDCLKAQDSRVPAGSEALGAEGSGKTRKTKKTKFPKLQAADSYLAQGTILQLYYCCCCSYHHY